MGNLKLKSVDVVHEISPLDFYEKYQKPGIPVVLKNFSKGWSAVRKWNFDYLENILGNEIVQLYGSWLENSPTRIEMPPVKEVPFKEYLELLRKNEESDLRIFLFNMFSKNPDLLKDFSFPEFGQDFLTDYPYVFFGAKGSDVRMHYDIDLSHVFITHFCGRKRITLFNQEQTKYLYRYPFSVHSAIDMSNIDEEKFPGIKYAEGWQVVLNHGETLYMPSGIWHYVEYLDSSFSLSLRSLSHSHIDKLKGAYNLFVIRKLDDYLTRFYGNKWSDYKVRRAIEKTNEILRIEEKELMEV